MGRTSKLLTQEVIDLAEGALGTLGRSGAVAIKLRAVISARKHGITAVANAFGTTKATLISWIKHVKDGSFNLLAVQEGRGRKGLLSEGEKERIKRWMSDDSQITVDKMRQKIILEFGVKVGRSTVHRTMKALDFSYITPRPKHYKQRPDASSEAKKKSSGRN